MYERSCVRALLPLLPEEGRGEDLLYSLSLSGEGTGEDLLFFLCLGEDLIEQRVGH